MGENTEAVGPQEPLARSRRSLHRSKALDNSHRGSGIPRLGVTEKGSNDRRGEEGELSHRAEGMPARRMSSRVPAGE